MRYLHLFLNSVVTVFPQNIARIFLTMEIYSHVIITDNLYLFFTAEYANFLFCSEHNNWRSWNESHHGILGIYVLQYYFLATYWFDGFAGILSQKESSLSDYEESITHCFNLAFFPNSR